MTSLLEKSGNWESLSGPANVVAREHDGGDFWELYGNLHGGRNIAMKKQHLPPRPGQASFSSEQVGGSGRTRQGPVFSEYSVSHPFGSGQFSTVVRLYQGMRRVDITTQLLNNEKFVRYRALFPTRSRTVETRRKSHLARSSDRWVSNSRHRIGLTTAMKPKGWPYSTVACLATTLETTLSCSR